MRKLKITVAALCACFFAVACNQGFAIHKISPKVGALEGGDQVEITGTGFNPDMGMSVYFGNEQAETVVVSSTDKLLVVTPAYPKAEKVNLRIALDDGREYLIRDGFAYAENRTIHLDDSGRRPRLRDKR